MKLERRAEDRALDQLENRPSPNVEIIPPEDGRVMICETDESGNLIRETLLRGSKSS